MKFALHQILSQCRQSPQADMYLFLLTKIHYLLFYGIILTRVGRAVAILLKNKMEESPGSNGQGAR